jgi:hypothetical protein
VLQFDGRSIVPQRFAIDFVQLFEDGKVFHGSLKMCITIAATAPKHWREPTLAWWW